MKLSFLLILIVFTLVPNGASYSTDILRNKASSPMTRNQQSDNPQRISAETQNSVTPTAVLPSAVDSPHTPIKQNRSQYESAYWPPNWSSWALVIIAIVASYIALRSLRTIEQQAKNAADGVVETRKAAEAAKQSADVADKSLRVVERAWLAVLFDQPFQPKVGTYNPIYYSVKNTGHTVAFLKDRKLNAFPWNGFMPKRELAPKPTGILPTIAAIFPGDKFPMEGLVDIDFTQQMINDAATGRFIFDVRGYVAYDDAFDNRHITRFCQAYDPTGDTGSFTYPREAQPGYNDAD